MSFYTQIPLNSVRKRKLFLKHFYQLSGDILDIGCSIGLFLQHNSRYHIGIDKDWEALLLARKKGFKVICANAGNSLPFSDNSFAAVNCDSLIEHLPNPFSLLWEIRRVLRPGGFVVIITPNIKRYRHNFWKDYTHIRPFTKKSLSMLAQDIGFSKYVVKTYALNYTRPIESMLNKKKLKKHPVLWFLEELIGVVFAKDLFFMGWK